MGTFNIKHWSVFQFTLFQLGEKAGTFPKLVEHPPSAQLQLFGIQTRLESPELGNEKQKGKKWPLDKRSYAVMKLHWLLNEKSDNDYPNLIRTGSRSMWNILRNEMLPMWIYARIME